MAHKHKNSVWCWVNGQRLLLHKDDLRMAKEHGHCWIKPATNEEVTTYLDSLKDQFTCCLETFLGSRG